MEKALFAATMIITIGRTQQIPQQHKIATTTPVDAPKHAQHPVFIAEALLLSSAGLICVISVSGACTLIT